MKKSSRRQKFSWTQLQHTMGGRNSIARETNFFYTQKIKTSKVDIPLDKITLWKEKDRSQGHHFHLSIDLNACIGCGSCIIACHAENNVPVVGKEEIRKFRDRLRIDRYYSTEESFESLAKKGL